MNTEDLNHVALHVSDLDASRKFYGELLGLEKIKRPDFNFPGEWSVSYTHLTLPTILLV